VQTLWHIVVHFSYVSINNFVLRYCNNNEEQNKVELACGLDKQPQIDIMNYVWDSFQHVFKTDVFNEIHYLDVESQDEIFNTILYILDVEILKRILPDDRRFTRCQQLELIVKNQI
jgi:hypothetical protein